MSFFRAIATDLDGTLASHNQLHPEVLPALDALRADGIATLLVTGRVHEDLDTDFPGLISHFDAVVTENGAVAMTSSGMRLLASPVEVELERALEGRGVQFRRGRVLLACDGSHTLTVSEEVQRLGLDCQLVHNREALMVLPSGISKGRGLFVTLGTMGLSHHNTVAVGDAANDISLLLMAEVGVAVANAEPSVQAHADLVLNEPDGAGVTALARGPLLSGTQRLCPHRRWIQIGAFDDGNPTLVPGSQGAVLIAGDSGTGKSQLTGLLVEQWVDAGYCVLVIDPEGDHSSLAELPGVVRVDAATHLPAPAELVAMLRLRFSSVVLDLSQATAREKAAYIRELPTAVESQRLTHGIPHWLVIDEAHLPAEVVFESEPLLRPAGQGICLVTYRPQLVPEQLRASMDMTITMVGGASVSGPVEANLRAVLSEPTGERPFTIATRRTRHIRHLHKYMAAQLPAPDRFYFHDPENAPAGNLVEFAHVLGWLSPKALEFHVFRRDFSRWLAGTVGDLPLAELAASLEQEAMARVAADLERARAKLVHAINLRYLAEGRPVEGTDRRTISLPPDTPSATPLSTRSVTDADSRRDAVSREPPSKL